MSNKSNLQNLIHQTKYNINYQLDHFSIEDINKIVTIIDKSENVYITGVGKSESIAKHICGLFKCIGVKCFFLNILSSLHGDIGTITNKDSVIFISKSGNTDEIISKIPTYKLKKCFLVSFTNYKTCKLNNLCDDHITIPHKDELQLFNENIPTNSCISFLLFFNIVVSFMANRISNEEYAINHSLGTIGEFLKK